MSGVTKSWRVLAVALAANAGFVDAIGFLATRGFFPSFMSGNTTRAGSAIGLSVPSSLHAGGGLVACFVLGVVLASLATGRVRRHRRAVATAFVALLLVAAAALSHRWMWPAALVAAVAMGAENLVFADDGEISVALTYVTGTLVSLGQRLADLLTGRDRWGWLAPFLQWAGLLSGAAAGALAWRRFALASLWGAAGATLLFALYALAVERWAPTRANG